MIVLMLTKSFLHTTLLHMCILAGESRNLSVYFIPHGKMTAISFEKQSQRDIVSKKKKNYFSKGTCVCV
jgi:hypothetical protein